MFSGASCAAADLARSYVNGCLRTGALAFVVLLFMIMWLWYVEAQTGHIAGLAMPTEDCDLRATVNVTRVSHLGALCFWETGLGFSRDDRRER
eukprot:3253291-Prymnesium_polylepis.1